MNRRVTVRGIVFDDNKLLCVMLKPYERSVVLEESYWCVPGGGIDIGEALLPALEREMIEETGIKPVVGNLLYMQQFVHQDTEQLELFFHIQNVKDYIQIDLSKASHAEEEIEQLDFVDPKTTHILPRFLTLQDIGADIASNASTKIFNYM